MDLIEDGLLWRHMMEQLAMNTEKRAPSGVHFWTDGDSILCDNPAGAEIVADFLQYIGYDVCTTGTYDEEEHIYYIEVD